MMDPGKVEYLRQASTALAKAVGKVNEAIVLMEAAEVHAGERTFREPLMHRILPMAVQYDRELTHLCKDIQRYIEDDRNLLECGAGAGVTFESPSQLDAGLPPPATSRPEQRDRR